MHGRAGQRAAVDAVLEAARSGDSGSLVIDGEPGIGKTCMCDYAAGQALDFAVVRAQGIESEYDIPFSGLSQLLAPLAEYLQQLPEPQLDALASVLALTTAQPTSPLTLGAATLSLLAAAADRKPVLAIVDDAQWLDAASAHAISFAARRLGRDAVAVILAQRTDDGHPIETRGLSALHLTGLAPEVAAGLLTEVARARVPHDVAVALVDATGGNPLALIEVARALSPGILAGRESLPDPLRVEGHLEDVYRLRIAELPERAREALVVLAAHSSGSLVVVGPALDAHGLGVDALEPAELAGVVVIDGQTASFGHPLMRAGAYHHAAPAQRRAAHRALAVAAASAGDAEQEAWHLAAAATAPDERVAAALERVAERAADIGGATAAAAAREQAALLTPPGDDRARRLVVAARSLFLAGRHENVPRHLDEALRQTTDIRVRGEAARLRSMLMAVQGDNAGAVAFARVEARAISPVDKEQAALVLSQMAVPSTWSGKASDAFELARESMASARDVGGVAALLATNQLAHILLFVGDYDEGARLLWQVYDSWQGLPAEAALTMPSPVVGLLYLEEYARAGALVLATVADARRLGAPAALPFNLGAKAEIDFCVGDWPGAYAAALHGVELGQETGQPPLEGYCLGMLAHVEAAQGRATDCRAHAQAALAIGDQFGAGYLYVYATSALGLLELSREHPRDARAHLAPLLTWMQDHGWYGMLTKERFGSDLIEATIRAGDRDEAERLLDSFESGAVKAGRIWAQAAAARCRALLANDAGAESLFELALTLHGQTTTAFEEARTNLCYGEWLRRSEHPREAVRVSGAARGTFERLGALPWLERTTRELAALGETVTPSPAPWSSGLTPQELQVALTVAEGATNKEAASTLFRSTKTIEFHLGNVYRKLGIHSRSQLVRLLSRTSAGSIEH